MIRNQPLNRTQQETHLTISSYRIANRLSAGAISADRLAREVEHALAADLASTWRYQARNLRRNAAQLAKEAA